MIIKTTGIKELQENIMSISRPFGLISIKSLPGLINAHLPETEYLRDILYLSFIDDDDLQSDDPSLFSIKDAAEIMRFIDKNKSHISEIVVQCEIGQSRSTAIAAVLQLYLNHDNKASKRYFKYYSPNKRVYKVMKQYFFNDSSD